MVRAFALLQERREEAAEPVVNRADWKQLVRLVQPGVSDAHRELLWSVCDHQNRGFIGESASDPRVSNRRPARETLPVWTRRPVPGGRVDAAPGPQGT